MPGTLGACAARVKQARVGAAGEVGEDHVIWRTRTMEGGFDFWRKVKGSHWRILSRGVTRSDMLCNRIALAALLGRLWRGAKVAVGSPVRKLIE